MRDSYQELELIKTRFQENLNSGIYKHDTHIRQAKEKVEELQRTMEVIKAGKTTFAKEDHKIAERMINDIEAKIKRFKGRYKSDKYDQRQKEAIRTSISIMEDVRVDLNKYGVGAAYIKHDGWITQT